MVSRWRGMGHATYQRRPPRLTDVGRKAPNISFAELDSQLDAARVRVSLLPTYAEHYLKLRRDLVTEFTMVNSSSSTSLTSTTTMAVETQTMPIMNGHAFNDDFEMANGEMTNGVPSLRFTSGLILPPPEIKCKFFH